MAQGRATAVAVPATPPLYGLLVAADTVDPADAENPTQAARWQLGIEWTPEQNDGGQVGALECDGTTTELETPGNPATQTADPFLVYAVDQCSTFGWKARDYEARARRQLLATQSYSIAREFQLGTVRTAAGLGNAALEDAELVTPSPASVSNATAELEGAIGSMLQGRRAMLHVTPQVFTLMKRDNLIFQAGQKWITAQGSIVVSDAGYTSGDDGVTMYATPLVTVALGEISILDATDRQINTRVVTAERLALVQVESASNHDDPNHASLFAKVVVNIDGWNFD